MLPCTNGVLCSRSLVHESGAIMPCRMNLRSSSPHYKGGKERREESPPEVSVRSGQNTLQHTRQAALAVHLPSNHLSATARRRIQECVLLC